MLQYEVSAEFITVSVHRLHAGKILVTSLLTMHEYTNGLEAA